MLTVPFTTIAYADAYHADHMFGETWEVEMEPEDKRRALITASRLLLDHVWWLPAYVVTNTVVPTALADATAEYARRLFERGDPFSGTDTEGLKKMKAGPVDIEFTDSGGSDRYVVPPEVLAMLAPLHTPNTSSLNVPLVRY